MLDYRRVHLWCFFGHQGMCPFLYIQRFHMCVSKTSWTRWWFHQPTHFQKYANRQFGSWNPKGSGWKFQTCLSCHHRSVLGWLVKLTPAPHHTWEDHFAVLVVSSSWLFDPRRWTWDPSMRFHGIHDARWRSHTVSGCLLYWDESCPYFVADDLTTFWWSNLTYTFTIRPGQTNGWNIKLEVWLNFSFSFCNRILKGGWWFPESSQMFPKLPQFFLQILMVPQLPPPLEHPPLRTLQFWEPFPGSFAFHFLECKKVHVPQDSCMVYLPRCTIHIN